MTHETLSRRTVLTALPVAATTITLPTATLSNRVQGGGLSAVEIAYRRAVKLEEERESIQDEYTQLEKVHAPGTPQPEHYWNKHFGPAICAHLDAVEALGMTPATNGRDLAMKVLALIDSIDWLGPNYHEVLVADANLILKEA